MLISTSKWSIDGPLQDKLLEAQRKEEDLNDQLRQYRDKLEASEVV